MAKIPTSPDIVDSNKLNTSNDITCKGVGDPGGKIWTGFQVTKNDKGEFIYDLAKCGNVRLNNNINELKKNTSLDNICECELIDAEPGYINCPAGKFINTYYPITKKVSCCKPCTFDNKIKATNDSKTCLNIYKTKNDTNLTCPSDQYLKGFSLTPNTTKLDCCHIKLEGSAVEKQKILDENCKKMGLTNEKCNKENLNNMTKLCKLYGINECNEESLKNIEDKCNLYGMKYYDTKENKFKNTDSYITCHVDNFTKLDNSCKNDGIKECNFYNIKQKQINDINNLKQDISSINKIENEFEKELINLKNIGSQYKLPIIIFAVIICLLIIGLIIFIIIKKKWK